MVTRQQASRSRSRAASEGGTNPSSWEGLSAGAFYLSIVLVIVRMTLQEMFRPDALPTPGGTSAPAMPGPATGLVLDLLCALPALLILARAVVDRTFSFRRASSFWPMLLLAAWTLASVLWADDRFAAIVQASHWAIALVMLWSTAQLVRDWVRLRLVAATAFGLLLVLLTQGYYYRFVDLPDLQREWKQDEAQWLRQRNLAPDSLEATQLGKNIQSGEVSGFSLSRNTYAALIVLLFFVSAGVVMQRMRDGDGVGWIVPLIVADCFGLWMLYRYVESKTAFATPVIGLLVCALVWRRRDWLARRAATIYRAAVGAFVLAVAAVVGHGLKHGTLLHVSLTFRWQYWVGAARLFVHHPWIGVGWANFGPHYLAYRLARAAEEPSDPHNLLVRAFVELGVVGGLLMLGWMLRLWWEMTVFPGVDEGGGLPANVNHATLQKRSSPVPVLAGIAVAAVGFNAAVSIDWDQSGSWIFLECFKRLLFLVALVLGMFVVAVRSFERQELDDRPAPWIVLATLVGLGLFLLHNLIDFSLFESGPMFLFALLAGSVLGIRLGEAKRETPVRRTISFVVFIAAGVAWVVAAGAGVWNVVQAEGLAANAEGQVRSNNLEGARESFVRASRLVPINGDYAFRAEQAALMGRGNPVAMRGLIDEAIDADPSSVRYRLARAVLAMSTGDLSSARSDYEEILRLDPNNRDLRLQYAGLLENLGERAAARGQYQRTLELNDELAPDEIRRLPPAKVVQVKKKIEELSKATTSTSN
jgi:O-antigen ligase